VGRTLGEEVLGKLRRSAPNVDHGASASAPLRDSVEDASVQFELSEIAAVARHVLRRHGRV